MQEKTTSEITKILHISFNQDQGCFACGTDSGFRIYNTLPYDNTFQRDLGGSIGITEMLFRSNIVAMVGTDSNPMYPPNKVIIWDDHEMKCIGELSFKTPVKGVRLRKDVIVAILETRVYVYRFSDFKLLNALNTCSNPKGLCALSTDENLILVILSKEKGNIQIINTDLNQTIEKKAHISELSAISLSRDGKLCATASNKGTLIRIFSVLEGNLLQEVRRGASKAQIHCIAFDASSAWLACTSDKKTVHIFALKRAEEQKVEEGKTEQAKNPTSPFKFMEGIVPYFKSEWSVAQFRLPEGRSMVAFAGEGASKIVGIFLYERGNSGEKIWEVLFGHV